MPPRRFNDIPFPSFSLVLSQYLTSEMRLPSYRTSYLLRFHPYPRVKLSQREMMQTIDDRLSSEYDVVEDDDNAGPAILIFLDLPEEQHPNAVNLQEAIKDAEVGAQPRVRRLSLTTLIIDLAILVVRKLPLKTTRY
ncbi:uncharacterized protein EDB91DRAFT_1242012 [Suillus paluster]|uniref:uncharacterized protein n=1 Tax=Suillus paluster TaxID=48578 RepID=UPI001B877420|nr:uncharacterized protein EDB91DRAFT_1242012 [Suillus paluster]KAG1754766.1 hypothetical protein EDB91DRAFT_1242012 [Suillus paluster]